MKKAFCDKIVESSNIEENVSSEEKDDILQLNKDSIKESMKNIPDKKSLGL